MSEKTINCMGLTCPLPIVQAKDAIKNMKDGDVLKVLVDNEISVQNLEKFAKVRGHHFSDEKLGEGRYEVTFTIAGSDNAKTQEEEQALIAAIGSTAHNSIVVVINSSRFGQGNPRLGEKLMKAFFFSLTKSDTLPETVLFYNSGASLTCKDSPVLEDLRTLACAGVTIKTCGTCLDFYNLTESLEVGEVTNMYDIVETLMNASKVIKP
jgi:selenium metabolism protein YedF